MVSASPRYVQEFIEGIQEIFPDTYADVCGRSLQSAGVWIHEPIPFHLFMSEQMGVPLWPKQEEDLRQLFGSTVEDTKSLFTQSPPSAYNCAALVYGKGSGKDLVSSAALVWFIHVLLCLKSPQQFLGIEASEAIDLAIASPTLRQTRRVTFTKFKNRLKGWQWMIDRIGELGIKNPKRYLDKACEAADFVELPHNIRIHNLPLEASRAEGFNMLAFILSEYAGLEGDAYAERATDVFSAFVSSGRTRFNRAWKGFIASFPRSATDPQEQLINACDNGEFPELFYVRRSTWEVHPDRKFEDFASDFARDPEGSWAKYGAQPRAAVDKFFRSPELIIQHASGGNDESLFRKYAELEGDRLAHACARTPDPFSELDDNLDPALSDYAFPRLHRWVRGRSGIQYHAHCDVGLSRDSAGVCVGHLEPIEDRLLPVIDFAFRWKASQFFNFGQVRRYNWRGSGFYHEAIAAAEIDLKTISDFFIWLIKARGFQFEMVSFDGFNSAQLKQEMMRYEVPALIHNVDKSDYDELKGAIYQRQLLYRADRILAHELFKLELRNGKVEAPRTKTADGNKTDSHKDVSDAVAAVVGRLLKLCPNPYELPDDDWYEDVAIAPEENSLHPDEVLDLFFNGNGIS